ncbi:MAG: hypothetical protein COA54_02320 [Thiotrichaceae bacterium]|nr:MAG: hypothetical protein COA54_02320 [Thiotrichaceae bacterium]
MCDLVQRLIAANETNGERTGGSDIFYASAERIGYLEAQNETLLIERNALAQALENFVRIDDIENNLIINKPNAIIAARQVLATLEA